MLHRKMLASIQQQGTIRPNELDVGRGEPQPRVMRNPFRYFNSSPEIIRLTVMMYIRYPLPLRQVEVSCSNAASISATRQYDSDEIGSARCSLLGFESGGFFINGIRTDASTWKRYLCESTTRRIISGERLIAKAKGSRYSTRNAGIARLQ